MEINKNIDLQKVSLEDIKLFQNRGREIEFLKQNGITNVLELLSITDIDLLPNIASITTSERATLRGIFELIRHKYLNEELIVDCFFDVSKVKYYLSSKEAYNNISFGEINLNRFGFSKSEVDQINMFLISKMNEFTRENSVVEFGSIIDVFAYLKENIKRTSIVSKLDIYLDSYQKKKSQKEEFNQEELENLRKTLLDLTKKRDKLNEQIALCEEKLLN